MSQSLQKGNSLVPKRNRVLLIVVCLLFSFAVFRFWSALSEERSLAAVNQRVSHLAGRVDVEMNGLALDPFAEFHFARNQRNKIDDFLRQAVQADTPVVTLTKDTIRDRLLAEKEFDTLTPSQHTKITQLLWEQWNMLQHSRTLKEKNKQGEDAK